MDNTAKQVKGLRKKYQTITAEVTNFMVQQGKWGVYTADTPEINMPTHLLSEEEVRIV